MIDVPQSIQKEFIAKETFRVTFVNRKKIVVLSYLSRIVKALQLSAKHELVICSGKFPLWLAILIRFRYGNKKIAAVVHGSELDIKSNLPRKLTRFALTKVNSIISVSNYTQQFLPGNLPDTITKTVIHNGINYEEFQVSQKASLTGEPSLITIGSVTPRKGQENVINALPFIKENFPQVHYHIVGKPDIKTSLEKLATNLDVSSSITFYGAVDRTSLIEKLAGATIKLMLSNHTAEGDFEGFGIAVLEANALGIPVIGSRNSGIEDAIFNYRTGILVDPKSPEEITDAIKTIIDNYQFYSFNAQQWAYEHDWKLIVQQYITALNLN